VSPAAATTRNFTFAGGIGERFARPHVAPPEVENAAGHASSTGRSGSLAGAGASDGEASRHEPRRFVARVSAQRRESFGDLRESGR
jgi:hypothetical protein